MVMVSFRAYCKGGHDDLSGAPGKDMADSGKSAAKTHFFLSDNCPPMGIYETHIQASLSLIQVVGGRWLFTHKQKDIRT